MPKRTKVAENYYIHQQCYFNADISILQEQNSITKTYF